MKNISKSVRMSQEVYDIINDFDGIGFNDKLEKLVLFCFAELPRIKKDIAYDEEALASLSDDIEKHRALLKKLDGLKYFIDNALRLLERM